MATHRFLCVSDLHGEIPPEVDETGVAAWLVAGDVAGPDGKGRRFLAWARHRKALVVRGNHDGTGGLAIMLRRQKLDLTGKAKAIVPGLWVVGVGWSGDLPTDLPEEWQVERRCFMARRMLKREAEPGDAVILLTHYPPKLPGLSFAGEYACVGQLMIHLTPIAVVFGHDHGKFSEQFVHEGSRGQTLLACPGPDGGTLDVDLENRSAKFAPWLPPTRGGG